MDFNYLPRTCAGPSVLAATANPPIGARTIIAQIEGPLAPREAVSRSMLKSVCIALLTLIANGVSANVPALANAGVDSCYKKCYLDVAQTPVGMTRAGQKACRQECEATPHYQCEKKCWNKFFNDSKKAKACTARCP